MAGAENYDVKEEHAQIDSRDVPFWLSSRLGLAVIGFLGFINVYAVRVNLSMAIVCMVNQTIFKENITATPSECSDYSVDNGTSSESPSLEGYLEWDTTVQGTVLGSFFWGYLIGQIPAGWIATKFGGKWIFASTMLIASLATICTPVLAEVHYTALIAIRILLGIATGMTFPAMHAMWGKWAPPLERTKLMTFTYAGAQVGIVITFPLSAALCKYGFAGGWPSVFYVTGGLCLIWTLCWMFLVSDDPVHHKRISEIEKNYIISALKNSTVMDKKKHVSVPWLKIFSSLPVWAIIVANITSDWGAYTLLINIPKYISDVLKFDITSNGLVSALPYIAFWVVINLAGWLADFLRDKRYLTTGVTRKIFTAFGKIIPSMMLVGLGYVDCSHSVIAIWLLVFAVSLTGTQYSGFLVNHVDIAPAFAGILFGISNSVASITGFISPVIVGVVTSGGQTRENWQIVFYIAAAIYIIGAIFYVVFASGDLQPWAQGEETEGKKLEVELTPNFNGEEQKMLSEAESI